MTSTAPTDEPAVTQAGVSLDRTVDWLVSLFLVGLGLLGSAAGLTSYWVADRELSVRIVTELPVYSTFLTDAELVDAVHQFMVWGGIGLLVAGGLVAAAGVAFLVARTRLRRRTGGETPTGLAATVVIGAAVTGVTSFLPFSAVIGGGVAGYLQHGSDRSGVATGALAGLAAAVPVVVVVGALAIGASAAGLPILTGVLVAAALVSVPFFCGLSALGGLLGIHLADRA